MGHDDDREAVVQTVDPGQKAVAGGLCGDAVSIDDVFSIIISRRYGLFVGKESLPSTGSLTVSYLACRSVATKIDVSAKAAPVNKRIAASMMHMRFLFIAFMTFFGCYLVLFSRCIYKAYSAPIYNDYTKKQTLYQPCPRPRLSPVHMIVH